MSVEENIQSDEFMNNSHIYNVNVDLPISGTISQCENLSGSTSSAYEEVSPQHTGTPVSNDSHSGRQNHSALSSKKSEISIVSSEETTELTIDTLERTLTEDRVSKIEEILAMLSCLNDKEKMLIQLRFPLSEKDNYDENNPDLSSLCDFGIGANQNEHSEALTWVMSHLEEDRTTCLKKQEVYEDYKSYCQSHNVKYLSTADFGKVMKKAFPDIKARRLGSRGQSKYCYSGLRNRNEIKSPTLIDVGLCCNKPGLGTESSHQDKNSDIDSNSSAGPHPDLSHVPEYELSSNILVDCALVIMDFVKRVGLTKEVTSLKQAVEHLLLNNQVEMRSPHALRLLPMFQQMESHSQKKKYLVDQVFRNVKKEETLSNPNSVASIHSSPQQVKRQKMNFASPIPDKVHPYYGHNKVASTPPLPSNHGYCHPSTNSHSGNNSHSSFNYAINPNISQHYYPNMMAMAPNISRAVHTSHPEMSPIANNNNNNNLLCQKSFLPNTFSTPIKDSPAKIISPTLNSPLLERNPGTTKKLELSNSSKSLYQNNPVTYSSIQPQTSVPDKSSKLSFLHSPVGFPYETNQVKVSKQPSYLDADVGSPSCNQMTSRNYVAFNDDYTSDNVDKLEMATLPLKRHIGSDYPIDFNPSPRPNHCGNDLDYGANLSSLSSGYRQQSCEENEYLDTPANSPTNRSSDHERSENSSRNNTPQNNCNANLSLIMAENKSMTKDVSFTPMMEFMPKNVLSVNSVLGYHQQHVHHSNTIANNNSISQLLNYPLQSIHTANDEFSVSSTTNTCPLDSDRHPSTTMLHSAMYK